MDNQNQRTATPPSKPREFHALLKRVREAMLLAQKPDTFRYDIALLDEAVRRMQAGKVLHIPEFLQPAEEALLTLWRSDLYCRFPNAPEAPPDTYLCKRSAGYHRTSDDSPGTRPLLTFTHFESNPHRH